MYYMTCSAYQRLYNRVCTGTLGVAIKVAGALAALVAVYIIGYLIGYYAHKCWPATDRRTLVQRGRTLNGWNYVMYQLCVMYQLYMVFKWPNNGCMRGSKIIGATLSIIVRIFCWDCSLLVVKGFYSFPTAWSFMWSPKIWTKCLTFGIQYVLLSKWYYSAFRKYSYPWPSSHFVVLHPEFKMDYIFTT